MSERNIKTNKNTKRILWITLIVTAIIPVYAQQYDPESDFNFDWDPNVKDGIIITEYIGTKKEIRIPPSIQNQPVTSIGKEAFWLDKNLTRVTIPNSVISIGDTAFYRCSSLASVTIPNSVTSIEVGAFFACISLTSVTIPDSVTRIGNEAFAGCTSLTKIDVASENTAYNSQDGVLYNKAKTTLIIYPEGKTGTTFTIPNSVTTIEDWAFDYCTNLASVTIPNSVTRIGVGAFGGCTSLTSITFQGTIKNFGYDVFPGDLREKYLASDGGPGTYRRLANAETWRKQ